MAVDTGVLAMCFVSYVLRLLEPLAAVTKTKAFPTPGWGICTKSGNAGVTFGFGTRIDDAMQSIVVGCGPPQQAAYHLNRAE